jgi:uncharacterized RDD family membrane protein YckC
MRSGTLLLLVITVGVVASTMVVSFVLFVARPDPAVKAGPMYVTFTLTTASLLLMLVLALNASFLPIMTRRRAADLSLMMWGMGITGVLTGMLTLGGAVSTIVMRFVVGCIAFTFIAIQNARLARAHAAAAAAAPATAGRAPAPAPQAQAEPRSRQRRGGRKG